MLPRREFMAESVPAATSAIVFVSRKAIDRLTKRIRIFRKTECLTRRADIALTLRGCDGLGRSMISALP